MPAEIFFARRCQKARIGKKNLTKEHAAKSDSALAVCASAFAGFCIVLRGLWAQNLALTLFRFFNPPAEGCSVPGPVQRPTASDLTSRRLDT